MGVRRPSTVHEGSIAWSLRWESRLYQGASLRISRGGPEDWGRALTQAFSISRYLFVFLAILRTFWRMMLLIPQTSRYSWPYSTSRRRCTIRVSGNLGRSIETEISHGRWYLCSWFYNKFVSLLKLGQKSFNISKKLRGMRLYTRISSERSESTSGEQWLIKLQPCSQITM